MCCQRMCSNERPDSLLRCPSIPALVERLLGYHVPHRVVQAKRTIDILQLLPWGEYLAPHVEATAEPTLRGYSVHLDLECQDSTPFKIRLKSLLGLMTEEISERLGGGVQILDLAPVPGKARRQKNYLIEEDQARIIPFGDAAASIRIADRMAAYVRALHDYVQVLQMWDQIGTLSRRENI